MLTFLPYELKLTSKPLDLPSVVGLFAATKEGEWVNNLADKRAWTPKAAAAVKDAEHRLYDVLATGGLTSYVHLEAKDIFRIVPAEYWRDDGRRSQRLATRVFGYEGNNRVPAEIADQPILILEEDVSRFLRHEASANQRAKRVPDGELKQWFEGYRATTDIETVSVDGVIVSAALAYFSGRPAGIRNRVRDLVGEISPNRKQGSKPIR